MDGVRAPWAAVMGRLPAAFLVAGLALLPIAPVLAATFTVDSTNDELDATPGDGICATSGGLCTLRAAIQEANALGGTDAVDVPSGTYVLTRTGPPENNNLSGDLDITGALTIAGAGAQSTIVDGNALDRVFEIVAVGVTLSGMTVRNGDTGLNRDGGGILMGSSDGTLTDLIISGNVAGRLGGGVHLDGGTTLIVNVTFLGNSAPEGAGLDVQDATATVRNSSFSNNTADAPGGGLHLDGGTLVIESSTFNGNSASAGGGLEIQSGSLSLTNVTISGNTASMAGGGFHQVDATTSFTNVTVTGNAAGSGGGIFRAFNTISARNTIIANNISGGDCSGAVTSLGNNLDSDGTCGLLILVDFPNTSPSLGPLQNNGGLTSTHALLAGSPAIDRGSLLGCPATDQRGVSRPIDGDGDLIPVCDIGAYESNTTPGSADLSLTKTVDDPSPNVGDTVTFTLTASNSGPGDATGVTVSDPLPAGFTFTGASGPGSYDPGTGLWTIGNLNASDSDSLDITATVNASGPYTNAAQVATANEPDPDSTPGNGTGNGEDDTASVTASPGTFADLSLSKTVDDGGPVVGTNIVFTLTVSNAGPGAASGVNVSDPLPPGFTFVSASGAGSYNAGTGLWTVGAVASGGSAALDITATVNAAGPYTNAAQVATANETDPDSTPGNGTANGEDDTASLTLTPVASADLSLTKTVDNATPNVGSNIVFTLIVSNAGPSNATGVAVTDSLPTGYAYVSDDGGGAYNSGTGVWTVGAVANGGSATLNITATVLAAGNYTNVAEVTAAGQTDSDSTPNNAVPAEDDYVTQATVPVPGIDLSLNKSVDNASPNLGNNVVFTLTVSNVGPSNATGVAVSDLLPTGYTYVSDNGGGAYNSGTGVWTVGAVANGGSSSLQIIATVLGSGNYTNVAEVTSAGETDPDSTPNNGAPAEDDYDSVTTTPGAVSDLSLSKTVDNATPNVGTNVVFTLTVSNAGPSDATGVAVTDSLPNGYTYVSDNGGGAYNSGTGVWMVGAVVNGGSSSLQITATVLASGTYTNTAEVTTSNQPDPDSTPNNGTVAEDDYDSQATTPVAVIDLSLNKTVDNATPNVGSNVVFTLTVSNAGPSNATGVAVTDSLPAGFAFVSASGAGSYNAGTGLWTIGAIASGGSAALAITATVNTSGPYTNAAQVAAANEPDPDSTPGNGTANGEDDTASLTLTPVASADLSLTKSVDSSSPTLGTNVVFTLTASNAGPSNATGVAVTDTLPNGYTYVNDDGGGAYNPGTGVWMVGALANGASAALNITATVLASGNYTNAAEVTSAGETDPDSTPNNGAPAEDDYDSVTTTPGAVSDLSLSKTVDNATPNVGTNVVFTLTVSNAGPSDATGVAVTDSLPNGYTYVSDNGGGAYNPGTGVWTVGAVVNGGSTTLNITATVLASGNYTNTAEVTASNQPDPDSTPANGAPAEDDFDSRGTAPVPVIDLSLTKTVDNGAPVIGTNIDFTLTVTNAGPSVASGVTVSDPLPAGFTFVSASGAGSYNSGTGLWTVGSVASGGSALLDITATVNAAGPYTNAAQVAAANEPDPDSTPGNGTANGEDDAASLTVIPLNSADLSLTKTVDNATPTIGTNVVFTLTVSNAGPIAAAGVTVSDLLPAGFSFVAASIIGVYDAGTGLWTVGGVPPGGSVALGITATVNASGPYTNAAQVASSNRTDPDSTPGNGTSNGEDDEAAVTVAPTTGALVTLTKSATHNEVVVGGLADYVVRVENISGGPLAGVTIGDALPAGFTYADQSARLVRAGTDGQVGTSDDAIAPLAAAGTAPVVFGPFDLAAGERLEVRYVLRVGSGVAPGDHVNRAVPLQGAAPIGNTARATVAVILDPAFDLSVVVGKVFEDTDRNGRQDDGERGVPGAMVALDDGTYALTDDHGRYHLPAVKPGQRMVKLNLDSLPPGTTATHDAGRVLWVTPGLIARANFGVLTAGETETIGKPASPGLAIEAEAAEQPVEVVGSVKGPAALINGRSLSFPFTDVSLALESVDDIIQTEGLQLARPVGFQLAVEPADGVEGWTMRILDPGGNTFRTFQGRGAPPQTLTWDGQSDTATPVQAGSIYQYQVEVAFADGSRQTSAWRVFGVNRSRVVSIRLTGDAFLPGSAVPTERTHRTLRGAADALREFPDEKILVEGHTDATGDEASNLDLSQRRAEAAAAFLVQDLGLDPGRIVTRWYGESRPIASNDSAAGRALNRRVEVRADIEKVTRTRLRDHFRGDPKVEVNGEPIDVKRDGRFSARVPAQGNDEVSLSLQDEEGRSVHTTVRLPSLTIGAPLGRRVIVFGGHDEICRVDQPADEGGAETGPPVITCRLTGTTRPDCSVELNGSPLKVGPDGSFASDLTLRPGENVFGLLVRDAQENRRIASLEIEVSDHDERGLLVVGAQAIPGLSVDLPPAGVPLKSPDLALAGRTDPGNRVEANGSPLEVGADGSFVGRVTLPAGASTLVIRVTDPAGLSGQIEREVRVEPTRLFLMALADGTYGRLDSRGQVDPAGVDSTDDYFTQGRLAFYLKGYVAGKYLLTSAFDSDRDQVHTPFGDLDVEKSRRILTNLDPDRHYPIYGDDSTVVHDVESQGRFYLALEGEALQALVGNYPLSLQDTELSAYQRTLHGGRLVYRSLSRTRFGDPETQVVLFTADVRHRHIRDELRATGGSLYYLSQRNVVEGSEEITLVVRDKNTGLVQRRDRQRPNADYTIKYEEGRVMFHRPLESVAPGGSLADPQPLSGHPVSVQVDYDTVEDPFEATASGARVRQQIGDRVAIGASYIDDELGAGPYELKGADAEVRLGDNSRIRAEFAESTGVDSVLFVSEDGGVSYTAVSTTGLEEGRATKVAADLDVGEWFGRPDRFRLRWYAKELDAGFFSNGNLPEQGTDKTGANASLKITGNDTLQIHHDREERTGVVAPGAVAGTVTSSLRWDRSQDRWGLGVEVLDRETADVTGATLESARLGSARLWARFTERFLARLERQQTLDGPANDQTTLDLEYRALRSLTLTARGTDGSLGSALQAGAILKVGDGEVYVAERLVEDRAGERTSSVLGVKSPLGASSKVYTEYQWEDGPEGARRVSLLGLQRQWDIAPGFTFLLSGEAADVVGGAQVSRRSAGTASLSYANGRSLRALTRNQIRFEEGAARQVQILSVSTFDYRLNDDVSLMGRYRYSRTEDRDTEVVGARLDDRTIGFAYRPVRHDRFDALARYSRVLDLRPPGAGDPEGSERVMEVVSIDTALDLGARLEWQSKVAARAQTERFGGLAPARSRTLLTAQRLNMAIGGPLDWGIEYRVLRETEGGDRRQGWLTELMWNVHRNMRLGVGFNFTDFSDEAVPQNDYSVQGWFFRLQGRY